jgi:hypothetical protein
MDGATLGAINFEPPDDLPEHDWFDLSAHERRLTIRVPVAILAALPQPHTVLSRVDQGDRTVRAEIQVAGDRQLDHLLVALGPNGEVIDPPEYAERRRRYALRLSNHLDGSLSEPSGVLRGIKKSVREAGPTS